MRYQDVPTLGARYWTAISLGDQGRLLARRDRRAIRRNDSG
jgi:hypothetical protein